MVQDGKYDRLLRLLYDDIEKYETEVGAATSCHVLTLQLFSSHEMSCKCTGEGRCSDL